MNRFLAEFISPRFSSLCYSDPTTNILCLDEVTNRKINITAEIGATILEGLKSITLGERVEINFNDVKKLRILSHFFMRIKKYLPKLMNFSQF